MKNQGRSRRVSVKPGQIHGLVFNLSNALIGGIFPYKDHISIEFSNGADFPDPSGMLEGKGKNRRHLKIAKKQDIDAKYVEIFAAEAVKN